MADIIADLAVRIGAIVSPYNAALADAAANGERFTALQMANADAIREANRQTAAGFNALKIAAEAVGVAVAASAAESVKWATEFQTQVTRLYTQAGLNSQQLADAHLSSDGLKQKLLDLGNEAGFAGDQIAAALYYPISAGLGLAQALAIVEQAERAAKISGADLTDTVVAATSVMRGYGASLSDPAKAMAEINAIVGQGMMTFGDFNTSVKGWEPTAATLKVDLMSAGAALDFLTDRGDTAATAGTRVSMMLAMMVGQSKQAAKFTTELGLSTHDAMSTQAAFNDVLAKSRPDGLRAGRRPPEARRDLRGAVAPAGGDERSRDEHRRPERLADQAVRRRQELPRGGGADHAAGPAPGEVQPDHRPGQRRRLGASVGQELPDPPPAARRDQRAVPQHRDRSRRLHDPEDLRGNLLAGDARRVGLEQVLVAA